ncbi:trypsin alpha-3-like isoform X1 [Bactrocera neohumeralis]|uniref:trypsin alpha-3-like isoform X1 n=1 Tax=Bactrocera neohumeralis TaxID=98809 RepID=UPI0021669805|nr:trypsin alpha-3-like isoform X1 [Bactrocera neohumeralis]
MCQFSRQLVLQFILCFAFGHIYGHQVSGRIVGGSAVIHKKYPYYVRLHYYGKFICGGSLVRNNAVLTAAHCVKSKNKEGLSVHADTINFGDTGVERMIKHALVPKGYVEETIHYDVAVLILSSAIPRANLSVIPLYKSAVAVGTNCLVIGHGDTEEDGVVSRQLREIHVPVVSRKDCQRKYRGTGAITQYMMCASEPGKKDSCPGDSGGPMICNGKQAGIVSWGEGCGRVEYPGVYTDISKVYGFIEYALMIENIVFI